MDKTERNCLYRIAIAILDSILEDSTNSNINKEGKNLADLIYHLELFIEGDEA